MESAARYLMRNKITIEIIFKVTLLEIVGSISTCSFNGNGTSFLLDFLIGKS